MSLSSLINHLFLKKNKFWIKKSRTTLIEHAAFFGSLQIIKQLYLNNVHLTPYLNTIEIAIEQIGIVAYCLKQY